jgi:hypothetical protein
VRLSLTHYWMKSIRARFAEVDPEFDAIRTERGHGYRWVV